MSPALQREQRVMSKFACLSAADSSRGQGQLEVRLREAKGPAGSFREISPEEWVTNTCSEQIEGGR